MVEQVLDENSDVYSDVIDDFDDDEDTSFNLLYAIIERLHNLMDNHHVSCVCGSEETELNIINGNIIVTCKECKKSKVIESNEETLARLLNAHAIVIGNRK